MIEYKGYVGVFGYDPAIEVFVGRVIDTRDMIYFEGRSLDELREGMVDAVDTYLALCKKTGTNPDKPYSGKLNVRVSSELHRAVAAAAAAERMSMNDWVTGVLRGSTGT